MRDADGGWSRRNGFGWRVHPVGRDSDERAAAPVRIRTSFLGATPATTGEQGLGSGMTLNIEGAGDGASRAARILYGVVDAC